MDIFLSLLVVALIVAVCIYSIKRKKEEDAKQAADKLAVENRLRHLRESEELQNKQKHEDELRLLKALEEEKLARVEINADTKPSEKTATAYQDKPKTRRRRAPKQPAKQPAKQPVARTTKSNKKTSPSK